MYDGVQKRVQLRVDACVASSIENSVNSSIKFCGIEPARDPAQISKFEIHRTGADAPIASTPSVTHGHGHGYGRGYGAS